MRVRAHFRFFGAARFPSCPPNHALTKEEGQRSCSAFTSSGLEPEHRWAGSAHCPSTHSLSLALVHAIDTCLWLCTSTRRLIPANRHSSPPPQAQRDLHQPATMRSASALFFAALGGVAFSSGADAAAGGFFAAAGSNGVRPRARGFLPGWGLPRHESVLDRVSDSCLLYRDRLEMRRVVCGCRWGARATPPPCELVG